MNNLKSMQADPGLLESLRRTEVFSALEPEQLQDVVHSGSRRHFAAGEWIVHHGDVWPHLFYVMQGEVNAVKESSEGRSLLLETIHTGEIFWGLAFFLEKTPMPAALVAAQACSLLVWSYESLKPYLDGRLSWELSRLMIQRILRASDIVEELAFQPVAGRLANLLLDRYPAAVDESVARDLTLDEMAARIGSTREMVCRLLYRFAEKGAIRINRTEFMITNRQSLKDLAQKEKG